MRKNSPPGSRAEHSPEMGHPPPSASARDGPGALPPVPEGGPAAPYRHARLPLLPAEPLGAGTALGGSRAELGAVPGAPRGSAGCPLTHLLSSLAGDAGHAASPHHRLPGGAPLPLPRIRDQGAGTRLLVPAPPRFLQGQVLAPLSPWHGLTFWPCMPSGPRGPTLPGGPGGPGAPSLPRGPGAPITPGEPCRESRGTGWGRPMGGTGGTPWPHTGVSPEHQLPLGSSRSLLKNDLSPGSVTK